ncbi:sorting nexin-12 [Sergentomyia squamirostris]
MEKMWNIPPFKTQGSIKRSLQGGSNGAQRTKFRRIQAITENTEQENEEQDTEPKFVFNKLRLSQSNSRSSTPCSRATVQSFRETTATAEIYLDRQIIPVIISIIVNTMMVEDGTSEATRRLNVKKQTLDDAYAVPANFLEIDVVNPMTSMTTGKKRYTDYEVRMRIVVPPLPGKAWKRQMPFRGDDGLFDENFIEERRKGLEIFINKIAGHPLAQNERCLHMFLQEPAIDKNYIPGKIRNT